MALLRGINLAGKNRIPMKDLAALFEGEGCGSVATYIQSGNVVFEASPALARRIPTLVEKAILERFGYRVPVVTRTGGELRKVVRGNPFLRGGADAGTLHVAFLAGAPAAAKVKSLDPDRSPPDAVRGARPRDLSPLSERLRAHQAHQCLLRLEARHHEHGAQLEHGRSPSRAHRLVAGRASFRLSFARNSSAETGS